MVYGVINEKDEKYYTYLKKVFDAIGNKQKEYNWLITDCECYPNNKSIKELLNKANEYEGFWNKPLTLQHPLAKVEIVPFDSSYTMIFSKEKEIIDLFTASFSHSERLDDF